MLSKFLFKGIVFGFFCASSLASAFETKADLHIYKCTFTVQTSERTEIYNGNLILSDVLSGTNGELTYLTLEPNSLSKGTQSARILAGNYETGLFFRMAINKKGDTLKTLVWKDIVLGAEGHMSATQNDVNYNLDCLPRTF